MKYSYDPSGNLIAVSEQGAPQIAGHPVNQVAELGDSVTFSVVLSDASGATFQWKFNRTDIPGATGDSLLLTNVSASNEGQYSVVVTNSAGSVMSAPAALMLRVFNSVTLPDGLVGWWRAEGNAQDSVGTNHGALRNGAGFAAGKVGQAFSLDGTDDCIEIPDAPSLRPVSLTLEAWVAFDVTSDIRVVFAKPVGPGTSDSYGLWLEFGTLRAAVGDAAGTGPELVIPFSPVSGRLYHLAYTFDHGVHQQVLYLDGIQVAIGDVTKSIGYDAQPLLLGRDTQNGIPSFFLQGRIDEASIYNRPLSGAEIAAIYNAGPAGKHHT